MTTTSAALLSDHVNYLIFRYLQECGHEATARSFYHDWYRPREYRDPEELPFASQVRRSALVSVIQDGIRYDELQGRATTNNQRRHMWSHVSARHPFGSAKNALSNGSDSVPIVKRKSTGVAGASSHQFDDAHAPAAKRQRTVPGEESVRTNGHRDAMDIDEHSPSALEDEDDAEPVSPAMVSEVELPVTRYDSTATQTEIQPLQKSDHATLDTQSIRFAIKRDNAKLFHAAWNPSKHIKDRRTLMTAGDKLCRLYKIPDHLDGSISNLQFTDEPSITENSMVTAVAWHPSGRIVTCAVDTLGVGERDSRGRALIDIGPDVGGTISHLNNASFLWPPGIVICAEYSPSGEHLMVASTNMKRGLVEVWATPSDSYNKGVPRTDPIAWCVFEHELTDVAWCEDLQIRACTAGNQASVLMLPEQLEDATEFTPENIRKHNFIEEVLSLPSLGGSSEAGVDYLYDNAHWLDIYIVQPVDTQYPWRMVAIDLKHHDGSHDAGRQLIFEVERDFFAAAMQPVQRDDDTSGAVKSANSTTRLLAVAFESGTCQIYELGRRDDVMICRALHPTRGYTFKMSHGALFAAAWSPDGKYLALAGDEQVQVWHTAKLESGQLDEQPVLTWTGGEAQKNGTKALNGGYRHRERREICLSWDAMGEKLCFAVDKQLAVIEIQQPGPTSQEVVMNGV